MKKNAIMKTKWTAIIFLALSAVLLLSACFNNGAGHNSNPDFSPKNPGSTSSGNISDNSTDAPVYTDNPSNNPEWLLYYKCENGTHNNVTEFENGMSVNRILYKPNDGAARQYIGIINKNGEIIYKLDTGVGQEHIVSFNVVHIGKKVVCFEYGDTCYLVNSDGKEIYRATGSDIILGVGDNDALIYEKEADISSATEKIGVINNNGEWTMPLTLVDDLGLSDYSKHYNVKTGICDYLGEDYYEIGGVKILNYKTKTVKYVRLPNSTEKFVFGKMKNGRMLLYNYPGITYVGTNHTGMYFYDFNDGEVYYIFNEEHAPNFLFVSLIDNRMIFKYNPDREYDTELESDMYYSSCAINDSGDIDFYQYMDYKTARVKYTGISSATYEQGITRIDWFGENFVVYIHGADDKNYFVVLNGDMDAISSPTLLGGSVYSCSDGKVLYYNEKNNLVLMKFDGTVVNDRFPNYSSETYSAYNTGALDSPLGFRDGISRIGSTSSSFGEVTVTASAYINEKGDIIFGRLVERGVVNQVTDPGSSPAPSTQTPTLINEKINEKSEGVMTYAQYEAAKIGDRIVIEGYIQAKQSWWDSSNTAVFYLADGDGAYFAYQVTCSEEDYNNKFTVGTKVQVIGYKTEYRGSIEISENAEIKVVGNGGKYIAKATDVTALLGTDDLIKKMNQFVAFKGMTVEASTDADGNEVAFLYKWNGTGGEGDDLYFNVSVNGNTYTFMVESYLCGKDTDVYKAVQALKIGDRIDMEGFLHWYDGPQPHITSVKKS